VLIGHTAQKKDAPPQVRFLNCAKNIVTQPTAPTDQHQRVLQICHAPRLRERAHQYRDIFAPLKRADKEHVLVWHVIPRGNRLPI